MKQKKLKEFICGVGIGAAVLWISFSGLKLMNEKPKGKIVTYEYIRECQCGETVEGYYSLVDEYIIESCSNCGYHKEGQKEN